MINMNLLGYTYIIYNSGYNTENNVCDRGAYKCLCECSPRETVSSPGGLGCVLGPHASRITQDCMQARINTGKVYYGELYKPSQKIGRIQRCALLWPHELTEICMVMRRGLCV